MPGPLDELVEHLLLERLEENLFRGPSRDIGTDQVYGGQVLGQALRAAQYTVEGRDIHSLHAYFLRRGDFNAPIIYEVDRSRDGRSFSARRIVAVQHGRPIFTMAASFQQRESGLDYAREMPDAPPASDLPSVHEFDPGDSAVIPEKFQRLLKFSLPFDLRPIHAGPAHDVASLFACRSFWIKTVGNLPDDDDLHRSILAYISDYGVLTMSLQPHGVKFFDSRLQMASIDHAMWFHRPMRVDRWLLCEFEPVSTSNARGIAHASIFQEDGRLVASTVQEGLIRIRDK